MVFSSLDFIFIFLPLVLLLNYILPKKAKNYVLLIFSLYFYGRGGPPYLLLMMISIIFNWMMGLFVDKYRESKIGSKIVIGITVLANLGVLGYFKYTNFFIDNINSVFGASIAVNKILLPIGISFYTFQAMSYVLDVYRKDGKVQKNPANVALYISFFPQLIAGPIVRYETVSDQMEGRKESFDMFASGVERFVMGLGKKVLIANTMGLIADEVFGLTSGHISVVLAWVGVIAYTFQIYYDFSGYSDMAIGLGRMFGFEFLENFNYPYIAKSITEFWRRWHISLGTWFRDYVYIPLGGNRKGITRTIINLAIVWTLTGIWHGASWNFVCWGALYGLVIILERLFLGDLLKKLWTPLQHLYTMFLVVMGWVLFRVENLHRAGTIIKAMFGLNGNKFINSQAIFYLHEYKLEFLLAIIISMPVAKWCKNRIDRIEMATARKMIQSLILPVTCLLLFLFVIVNLANSTFNPFIYFRF